LWWELDKSETAYRARNQPIGSIAQLSAELELQTQDHTEDERPYLYEEAAEVYAAFFQLLELTGGGMELIPTIRYEAVTCWLDEHDIFQLSEREEIRNLLRSMLNTHRKFRDEHKEK
jgi:hypothetical protein